MLGGITLFFFEQLTFEHVVGNLVALASGVAPACTAMAFRKVAITPGPAGPSDPVRPMLLGNLIATLLGAPFMLASAPPGLTGWTVLIALGLFQQTAAFLCYAWAICHATALETLLIPGVPAPTRDPRVLIANAVLTCHEWPDLASKILRVAIPSVG